MSRQSWEIVMSLVLFAVLTLVVVGGLFLIERDAGNKMPLWSVNMGE